VACCCTLGNRINCCNRGVKLSLLVVRIDIALETCRKEVDVSRRGTKSDMSLTTGGKSCRESNWHVEGYTQVHEAPAPESDDNHDDSM
jgi:hypothetical protein